MAEQEEEQATASRAAYERPRIEETARFERLVLTCLQTESEFDCSGGPFENS